MSVGVFPKDVWRVILHHVLIKIHKDHYGISNRPASCYYHGRYTLFSGGVSSERTFDTQIRKLCLISKDIKRLITQCVDVKQNEPNPNIGLRITIVQMRPL